VGDEADVRLVDTHSEGVRGHDHPAAAGHECGLDPGALFRIEAGVIPLRGDTKAGKGIAHRLDAFSSARIDGGGSPDALEDPVNSLHPFVEAPGRLYHPAEIGAIERADLDHRPVEPEVLDDVLPDPWRRRGGEGDQGSHENVPQVPDSPVGGSKVVSPFRDAVGFVHGQEPDVGPADLGQKLRDLETLRRHEEKIEI
jgi:hypothetical protein